MSQQWLRKISLIVGDASGKGLDLSDLHIRFAVWSATTQSPKHARIRIYNVADNTALALRQEFTQVFLQAGYDGNFGQIFSGAIKQAPRGRENATDTFVELIAADGDEAYNWAVVNTTLAAGWSQTDSHRALMQTMSSYGVSAGYTPEFSAAQLPRGKVMFGGSRDYMRQLAGSAGAQWSIIDGQLHMVKDNDYIPGETIVLTSNTGLIGMPTQTVDGIVVKALLNPNIQPGRRIQLDNASIQQAGISVDYSAVNYFPSTDSDGFYKVFALNNVGDTRGQDFYSNIICSAVNGTQPISSTYANAVVNGQP
ncbi:phage protein [Paraburkholderia dioscoreae]|uniref:Phage protein n=1 Tax=Paraburkholderia dioscoreae TaxID=2604047 RepID=A0A5Q4ZE87_9BURK|nr:hypothetical protein [Paraburkholderia dioscoreae]VVD29153.1 conserved protein of unknown function [Paraburkholderia dioscoreae]